jgi:hypothetical protein
MKHTRLWDQPERYIVVQAHNYLYPVLPTTIKCKHRWLHERILCIRKEYNLFQMDAFDENMYTHLISNMLTKWRTVQADCDGTADRPPKKPFSYFSFPVRYRMVHWMDSGHSNETLVRSGFFNEDTAGSVFDIQYTKSVLTPGESALVCHMMTPEFTSKLAELYNGDTAEGPLYFYCEVASLYRSLVAAKKIRPTVLLWKFEQAVVNAIVGDKPHKRQREGNAVVFPQPSRVKLVHN